LFFSVLFLARDKTRSQTFLFLVGFFLEFFVSLMPILSYHITVIPDAEGLRSVYLMVIGFIMHLAGAYVIKDSWNAIFLRIRTSIQKYNSTYFLIILGLLISIVAQSSAHTSIAYSLSPFGAILFSLAGINSATIKFSSKSSRRSLIRLMILIFVVGLIVGPLLYYWYRTLRPQTTPLLNDTVRVQGTVMFYFTVACILGAMMKPALSSLAPAFIEIIEKLLLWWQSLRNPAFADRLIVGRGTDQVHDAGKLVIYYFVQFVLSSLWLTVALASSLPSLDIFWNSAIFTAFYVFPVIVPLFILEEANVRYKGTLLQPSLFNKTLSPLAVFSLIVRLYYGSLGDLAAIAWTVFVSSLIHLGLSFGFVVTHHASISVVNEYLDEVLKKDSRIPDSVPFTQNNNVPTYGNCTRPVVGESLWPH